MLPVLAAAQSISSFTISPTSVNGTGKATGKVTLSAKAASATTVSFTSTAAAVPAPASITIAAGATVGTVVLATTQVATDVVAQISAKAGTSTQKASLTVLAPRVNAFRLSPATVQGGASFAGIVTISGAAPAGGLPVTFTTSSGAVKPPSGIVIPAGQIQVTGTFTTSQVSSVAAVALSAKTVGTALAATETLNPVTVQSVTVTPKEIKAGTSTTGTVTLSGVDPAAGVKVGLTSSQAFATVPSTVTVAHGTTSVTFPIQTQLVPVTLTAVITATYAGKSATGSLIVDRVSDLAASPWPKFHGGSTNQGLGVSSGATGQSVDVYDIPFGIGGVGKLGLDGHYYAYDTHFFVRGYDTNGVYTNEMGESGPWAVDSSGVLYDADYDQAQHYLYQLLPNGNVGWFLYADLLYQSPPVCDNSGNVFCLTNEGLGMFNKNGQAWTQTSSATMEPPVLCKNFDVCVVTSDGNLTEYDHSGAKVWMFNMNTPNLPADTLTPTSIGFPIVSDTGSILVSYEGVETNAAGHSTNIHRVFLLNQDGTLAKRLDYPGHAPLATFQTTVAFAPDGSFAVNAYDPSGKIMLVQAYHADASPEFSLTFGRSLPGSSCAMQSDGSTLFFDPNGGNVLDCYNTDGTFRWSKVIGSTMPVRGPGKAMIYVVGSQMYDFGPDGNHALSASSSSSSPVIRQNGAIFFGTDGGNMVLATDQGIAQTYTVGSLIPGTAAGSIPGTPLIDAGGLVYVGSANKYLYAFNPGGNVFNLDWSYFLGTPLLASPAIGFDGTLYVGGQNGDFLAVSSGSTLKYFFQAGAPIVCTPAVDSSGNVYFGTTAGKLFKLDYTGKQVWSVDLGTSLSSSPALGSGGVVYVGGGDGKLYSISSAGAVNWGYATGAAIASSPAVAPNGTIYVGSDDFNLYAINSDGTLKWQIATLAFVRSSPAIGSDGTIYFGSSDHNVYAVSSSGVITWQVATAGPVVSSPAIGSSGQIYITSADGRFRVIH